MPEHQQTQQSAESKSTVQKQAIPQIQAPVSHPMAIIQRARINPKSLTHADVMQLQRTIGNRAVGRLFSEIGLIPSTAKPVKRQEIPEEEKACPSCMQRQEIPEEEEPLQGKLIEPIQRQEIPEEEEPLQGKFENKPDQMACPSCFAAPIVQRQELEDGEKPLQGKMIETVQRQEIPEEEEPLQTKRENNTGMPDNLKAGVESLSGIDMSDVKVHYNSSKPVKVGALAYTQGTNIHVAPGQEKHLPHEAWHVIQQVQGRVRPTMRLKDMTVNDDAGLEKEADIRGEQAYRVQHKSLEYRNQISNYESDSKLHSNNIPMYILQKPSEQSSLKSVIQCELIGEDITKAMKYLKNAMTDLNKIEVPEEITYTISESLWKYIYSEFNNFDAAKKYIDWFVNFIQEVYRYMLFTGILEDHEKFREIYLDAINQRELSAAKKYIDSIAGILRHEEEKAPGSRANPIIYPAKACLLRVQNPEKSKRLGKSPYVTQTDWKATKAQVSFTINNFNGSPQNIPLWIHCDTTGLLYYNINPNKITTTIVPQYDLCVDESIVTIILPHAFDKPLGMDKPRLRTKGPDSTAQKLDVSVLGLKGRLVESDKVYMTYKELSEIALRKERVIFKGRFINKYFIIDFNEI